MTVLEDCGVLVYCLSCRQEVNFVKSAGCYLSGRILFNGGDEAYLHTRGRLPDLERIKQGFTGGLGNNVGGQVGEPDLDVSAFTVHALHEHVEALIELVVTNR